MCHSFRVYRFRTITVRQFKCAVPIVITLLQQARCPHRGSHPNHDQMTIFGDCAALILSSLYRLIPSLCTAMPPLSHLVVPRPIALTSTQAPDGTVNVAPFSYFNTVGHDPPTLAVSICRNGNGSKKDSLVNIEANGCVVRQAICRDTEARPITSTSSGQRASKLAARVSTLMSMMSDSREC